MPRRRRAPQPGGAGEQIQLPPWVSAVLESVPPPVIVFGIFAATMARGGVWSF